MAVSTLTGKAGLLSAKGIPSLRPARTFSLARTLTLRSSTATCHALPLPFLEVSVSMLDTLDLVRSSVQSEVVFQATLQVPAHHAVACRIEAYDTPFTTAPGLRAEPGGALSEADKQYAACLASPPDLEEAHNLNIQQQRAPAGATASTLLSRSAPSLRFASALTVSLSMRQRSSQRAGAARADDDGDGGGWAMSDADVDELRQLAGASGSMTARYTTSLARSSSSSRHGQQAASSAQPSSVQPGASHRHPQGPAGCSSIPEAVPKGDEAAGAEAAASSAVMSSTGHQQEQQQQQRRPPQTGLLRMESFTAGRRQTVEEVPLTVRLANKGVATLLGAGMVLLVSLEARFSPAATLLQHQVRGYAAREPTHSTPAAMEPGHC